MLIHEWVYFSTHQYTFMGWVLKVPAAQYTKKAVKLPPGKVLRFKFMYLQMMYAIINRRVQPFSHDILTLQYVYNARYVVLKNKWEDVYY